MRKMPLLLLFWAIFALAHASFPVKAAEVTTQQANQAVVTQFKVITADGSEFGITKPVYNAIQDQFDDLNELNSTIFNTRLLRQPTKLRFMLRNLPKNLGRGQQIKVPLAEHPEQEVFCTFFDRGSSELMVIGGGFANSRELLAPLLGIFPRHNVVIFDHVGHGLDHKPDSMLGKTLKTLLGVDFTAVEDGSIEEEAIMSVATHFKSQKTYKTIIGVGFCYATAMFIRTAARYPRLFDKLIFDGAWESPENLLKRFTDDPKLFFDPQRGDPAEYNMPWYRRTVYHTYLSFTQLNMIQHYVQSIAEDSVAIGPCIEKLTHIPILFFHASNDLLIPDDEFKYLWELKQGQKVGIITDSRHLQNHIKYKELFTWAAHCFLATSPDNVGKSLMSPVRLKESFSAINTYKENLTDTL